MSKKNEELLDWHKVPEITPGGKPYYYTAEAQLPYPYSRFWIVWHRFIKSFIVQNESDYSPNRGYFHTIEIAVKNISEGKKVANQLINELYQQGR